MSTIINAQTDLGDMVYPFLLDFPEWQIVASRFDDKTTSESITLRYVKDNRVIDILTSASTDEFLKATGLTLHPELKGNFVLGKRLSRIFRPYRFWGFFAPNEISIDYNPDFDAATWDGCALMSRHMALSFIGNFIGTPYEELYRRELETTGRFNITIMHDGGQEKGHALVIDDLAFDFVFPAGSTKREITLSNRVFVGIEPIHSHDEMRLDIQSLINLYPFFRPEHLLAWMQHESYLFLNSIESGQYDQVLSRLNRHNTNEELQSFRNWNIGDYIASGGELMWFPGAIRGMARQHLTRLNHKNRDKYRFPIPGGRYYIFPAAVGNRQVEPGQIELEPQTATAWVSSEDWNNFVVEILGGCDGDDAVWTFPFTDYDNNRKIIIWRSPNQLGEYVILNPTDSSHTIAWQTVDGAITWPRLDSRQLPGRIDTASHAYGDLQPFLTPKPSHYSIESMNQTILEATMNQSVLGRYVNILMVTKAVYGKLPHNLPARLEDVIDGTVKEPRDMWPVLDWIDMAQKAIKKQGKPIPASIANRLNGRHAPTENHWLDVLSRLTEMHIAEYELSTDELAQRANTSAQAELVETCWKSMPEGDWLSTYQRVIARNPRHAEVVLQNYLDKWPQAMHPQMVMGAAAKIFSSGLSDAVLWTKTLSPIFLQGLREIGLIGLPTWTTIGAVRYFETTETTSKTVVQVNGTWFNWLKATREDQWQTMKDVPAPICQQAKNAMKRINWQGKVLRLNQEGQRLTMYTQENNLLGFIAKDDSQKVADHLTWRILNATSHDGNLTVILEAI
ncbi:MAG: hypothetical protein H6658_12290 [Ardenticatenaceae bacterium]|nr:hypothetical protein [Ardenticatenaceae bacterium]